MKKKISIDQLMPGMHVVSTNRNWLQLPFFKRKISGPEAINKLRAAKVTELIIDTSKGSDIDENAAPAGGTDIAKVQQHFSKAGVVHDQVLKGTADIMEKVRAGHAIDNRAADAQVEALTAQLYEDPQSLLCISVLRNSDEYTYDHCVNMSILALFVGKYLNFSRDELLVFGKGILLHDIGKCMLPREILRKPGKLTAEERRIMGDHVMRGHNYLKKMQSIPQEVLDITAQHHEWVNGTGYPNKLNGDQISWFTKLSAVMDVYDSLLHKNYYKDANIPTEVLSIMEKAVGTQFDDQAFKAVKGCLGIYPPGTSLMLDSGEIGIAFEPNHREPERPKILLITGLSGAFLDDPVAADLTEKNEDGSFKRSIVTDMTREDTNFNPLEILSKNAPVPN
jgi:putative nucleotidyltransferase with HDIG domain